MKHFDDTYRYMNVCTNKQKCYVISLFYVIKTLKDVSLLINIYKMSLKCSRLALKKNNNTSLFLAFHQFWKLLLFHTTLQYTRQVYDYWFCLVDSAPILMSYYYTCTSPLAPSFFIFSMSSRDNFWLLSRSCKSLLSVPFSGPG